MMRKPATCCACMVMNRQFFPKRLYCKKVCTECCKDVSQTKDVKEVREPRYESTVPYRPDCPEFGQTMPTNYDPYRIKVPEIAVPPLPPSNAKPMLEVAKTGSPCSGKGAPPPKPCPPPPPYKRSYWGLTLVIATVLAVTTGLYKWWLHQEYLKSIRPEHVFARRKEKRNPNFYKDVPPCVQYLIIGTGPAGWGAYRAIRELDFDAKVFFMTKEDLYPYSRTPISKHMWWNGLPPDIHHLNYRDDENVKKTMYLVDCDHFDDVVAFQRNPGPATGIALGYNITSIDPDKHCAYVETSGGQQPIFYERCLFAPGSIAKNLEVFKRAPKFVRDRSQTLRDVTDLEKAYAKVRDAKHVTIVGSGPLACELAYHLGRMQEHWQPTPPAEYKQPQITMLCKDAGVLGGLLPSYLGEWAAEMIKCENVNIVHNAKVFDAYQSADDRLTLTLSNNDTLKTDYVLVAVGAEPRIEVAEPSFLETDPENGGFVVNTELLARTHLYIAGDAASFYSQWKNTRMRIEHYDNANEMGYIAGTNMAGYWTPCNIEPHFWLKLGKDIEMEVVGEIGACMASVGIFKPCERLETEAEKKYIQDSQEKRPCFKNSLEYRSRYRRGMVFYLRGETVVGIVFWNFHSIEDRAEVATELLRARPSYKDINLLAELLGFPDISCEPLPKAWQKEQDTCIDEKVSKWLQYEDYDKMGALSKPEKPEITQNSEQQAPMTIRFMN